MTKPDEVLSDDPAAAPAGTADGGAGLQAVPERAGVTRAVQLFATGALGGTLTLLGLGVMAIPTTHRCCGGASASQRMTDQELKRRCMELGVTPDELAALDAAATAAAGAPAGEE